MPVTSHTSRNKTYWQTNVLARGNCLNVFTTKKAAEHFEVEFEQAKYKKEQKRNIEKTKKNKISNEKYDRLISKRRLSLGESDSHEKVQIELKRGSGKKEKFFIVDSVLLTNANVKTKMQEHYEDAMHKKLKTTYMHVVVQNPPVRQYFELQQGHDFQLFGLVKEQASGGNTYYKRGDTSGATFKDLGANAKKAALSLMVEHGLTDEAAEDRVMKDVDRLSRGAEPGVEYDTKYLGGVCGLAMFGQVIRCDKSRVPKATKNIRRALLNRDGKKHIEDYFGKDDYIGMKKGGFKSGPERLRDYSDGESSEGSDIDELRNKNPQVKKKRRLKKKRIERGGKSTKDYSDSGSESSEGSDIDEWRNENPQVKKKRRLE